ncbi:MAG: DUF1805 domain-containing protein [Candidatus Omnitrophica bacterium]|nr:DUF1805 domain-containing protein [Candidatus Omnitrophota bacterium]
MLRRKKIKIGKKYIQGYLIPLQKNVCIVLRGSNGYVMCGYLDIRTANKSRECAVRISGVTTFEEALNARAESVSRAAESRGVKKNQRIREILPRIV